jgi:hypothetical protein
MARNEGNGKSITKSILQSAFMVEIKKLTSLLDYVDDSKGTEFIKIVTELAGLYGEFSADKIKMEHRIELLEGMLEDKKEYIKSLQSIVER